MRCAAIGRKLIAATLLTALTIAISSCGWQLRGAGSAGNGSALPGELHVKAREPNSAMARTLRRILTNKNVRQSSDAPLALVLQEAHLDKRPLSVSETGVTAQYQLILTIRYVYQRTFADNRLFSSEPQQVSSWRSYDFDPKIIVAKNQEEQALLEEMREELAWRILDAVPELSLQSKPSR